MLLAEEIREYALDLGFDGIGFAAAAPFAGLAQALQEREEGYRWAGEALQLNRAADPQNVLPGARSLVALIFDYHKLSFPRHSWARWEKLTWPGSILAKGVFSEAG